MKRAIRYIIVAMAALLTLSAIPIEAANASDTPINFKVGYYYAQAGRTASRQKTNATSVYIKSTTSFDLYIRTFGSDDLVEWSNLTKGSYARIPKGEWFIKNYIYEVFGKYANAYLDITKYEVSETMSYATGLWSPDSVGKYPSAN